MNHNAGTVPFNYGDLVSITEGPTFWFQDKGTGVIRGLKLVASDGTYRLGIGDNEIIVKRVGGAESSARPGVRTPIPGSIQPVNPGAAPTSKPS